MRRFWAMSHHPNQMSPTMVTRAIMAKATMIGVFALVYVSLLINRGLELVISPSRVAFHALFGPAGWTEQGMGVLSLAALTVLRTALFIVCKSAANQ